MAKTFIPVFYHICGFWQGGKGIPFADFTHSRRARIRERAVARARCGASCACKTRARVSGVKPMQKTARPLSGALRASGELSRARAQGAKRDSLHRCRCGGRQGGRCGERQNKRERICAPFPQTGLPCIPVSAGRGAGRKLPGTLPAKIPYRAGSCSSRTRGRAGRRPRAPS